MRTKRSRYPLAVEGLEGRLALSAGGSIAVLTPDVNLQAFATAYLSHRGQPNYNPALDFNGNGYIGQGDVRPILRALAPITPHEPQVVSLRLGPGDQVRGHHPANSGGVTRRTDVTVIGHTTPNSIVFTDSLTGPRAGDFRFVGLALPVDSKGVFSYKLQLTNSLTQTEYLAIDPFGHQTIRAFPILKLPA